MNIGDKVRLIHSKEEGIVTRVLPNNVIEIEIEDGFRLPVLKRELAVVSAVEAQVFRAIKPQPTPEKATENRPTPFLSGLSFGMPWQTWWLMEVQIDLG